ncbi:MAG: hypothetical protein M1834_002320 [Cirrosporium novae-zelandiae]|nr:MAG: hypothetical protein M1834_002320 [Cirrosporium novae-zelandiae]
MKANSSCALTTIYECSTPKETVLPLLRSHLPHTLSVYRRIQSHLHNPSPTARILTTFPPETCSPPPPRPWLVAWVDRTRAPESEVWLFSTYELPLPPPLPPISDDSNNNNNNNTDNNNNNNNNNNPRTDLVRSHLLTLIKHIHAAGEPPGYTSPTPQTLLISSLHSNLLALLPRNLLHRDPPPYIKYIFAASRLPPQHALPQGFHYGRVHPSSFPLVLSRTPIRRTARTLALFPSVAIYVSESTTTPTTTTTTTNQTLPIAWAFLGLDGSLSTLNVEEEYRGRGLAKRIVLKLFREELKPNFGDEVEEGWAHSDVLEGNWASRGVAEALGGRVGWVNHWAYVNLGEVGRLGSGDGEMGGLESCV